MGSERKWTHPAPARWAWVSASARAGLELQDERGVNTEGTNSLGLFLKSGRTYTSQSCNVESHNTPTPAAGFSTRNTTDADGTEGF